MHAYDQREVVIGAGTLAAEVEEEAGVPDRALVSVGGGGLIAGIASWFQDRSGSTRSNPSAPTLYRAREVGPPVDVAVSASPPIHSVHVASADRMGDSTPGDGRHLLTDAAPRHATATCGRRCAWRSSLRRRCPWRP